MVNLAKKLYKYSSDYLGDNDYYEVFDYENQTMIQLTKSDFDLGDMEIIVEVDDANLLHKNIPPKQFTKVNSADGA